MSAPDNSDDRRRPPWPLIAIAVGFVITIGLVIAMFASRGGQSSAGYLLPTVDSLASQPSGATSRQATVTTHDDGCAFVTVDGATAYAIWPSGFSQLKGVVTSKDGKTYKAKKTFTGTIALTDRATALKLSGGDEQGAIGGVMTYCLGSKASNVAVIASIP